MTWSNLCERLQWGHGDEAVEEEPGTGPFPGSECRFNGATAMKPWKRDASVYSYTDPFTLQWGHGDEAVEEGDHSRISSA